MSWDLKPEVEITLLYIGAFIALAVFMVLFSLATGTVWP